MGTKIIILYFINNNIIDDCNNSAGIYKLSYGMFYTGNISIKNIRYKEHCRIKTKNIWIEIKFILAFT